MSNIKVFCCYDKMVNITELAENPRNPNKHPEEQLKILAKVIKQNGWRAPITVSKLSGFIVKGHGRLQAAKLLGCEKVPVDYQEYENESLEYADLMADNRIAELSEIDNKKLLELFHEFDVGEVDFDLSGYTEEFYKDLASAFDEFEPTILGDPDEVPEEVETRAKRGDIWQLGNHRLMCGNALIQEDIDKLLNGVHCELTFTDPPYQLDTQGGGILKTANSMKQIKQNGVDTFNPSELILQSETNIYCHNKPLIKKYIELAETNNKPYDLCFYKKFCTVPNYKGHMMTDCEYIAIIGNQDPNKGLEKELYSKCYIGKKDQDNKLSYSKPVELCAKYIKLYAKDKVLDLFGGSGSTLIACEQLNRKCYTMELDPYYCDVIITRWEALTRKKAILSN